MHNNSISKGLRFCDATEGTTFCELCQCRSLTGVRRPEVRHLMHRYLSYWKEDQGQSAESLMHACSRLTPRQSLRGISTHCEGWRRGSRPHLPRKLTWVVVEHHTDNLALRCCGLCLRHCITYKLQSQWERMLAVPIPWVLFWQIDWSTMACQSLTE